MLRLHATILSALVLTACASAPPIERPTSKPAPTQEVAADPAQSAPVADDQGDLGPIPVTASDPTWGSRDALVTIVEFGDLQCGYCAKVSETLAQLEREYGPERVRVVWKNFPISSHADANQAALFGLAIFQRFGAEAFFRYREYVFTHRDDAWGGASKGAMPVFFAAMQHAGATRLDITDIVSANAQSRQAKIDADAEEAKAAGVTGTPAFFINGIQLKGAQPIETFKTAIDQQIERAQGAIRSGIPARQVYAFLTREQWTSPKPKEPPPPEPVDTAVWKVPVGTSPVRGNADALVTIVEFADFQCPYCAKVEAALNQIPTQYGDKVRLVYKHQPLPFHQHAEPAAELAIEARVQKGDAAFWEAHDALYADREHQDDQALGAIAARLHLSNAMSAIAKHKHQAIIDEDSDLADSVDAQSTPQFFINGRRLVGAQPFEKFKEVIDEELAKADELVKAGTPAKGLYAKIIADGKQSASLAKITVPAIPKDAPSLGVSGAKVTVQEFADFQCPFCKKADQTMIDLEKELHGKVRIVWRQFPLSSIHANAEAAAEASVEAFKQKGNKAFWDMHELLLNGQGTAQGLERPALLGYASQIGLDVTKFAAALDAGANKARVEIDTKAANDAHLTSTPSFVINGYVISGAQPIAKFKKVVRRALAEK